MAAQTIVMEQLAPSAATEAVIYTVPAGRRARVRLLFTNTHASTASDISVALMASGETIPVATKEWITKDSSLAAQADDALVAVVIGPGTSVVVETSNATVSFTCNGLEEDVPT